MVITCWKCKERRYSLEQELRADHGLPGIESRTPVQRMAELIEHLGEDHQELQEPGQLRYVAVSQAQPPAGLQPFRGSLFLLAVPCAFGSGSNRRNGPNERQGEWHAIET